MAPKTPAISLYLVRHGETQSNLERIFRNPMTQNLTEKGRNQAKLLGERLADIPFSKVYSSNFPRAIETAKIILAHSKTSKNVKVQCDERIRERDHKNFEGKSYDTARKIRGKGIEEDDPLYPYRNFSVQGMESVQNILSRMESFFDNLLADHYDKINSPNGPENILIVSHGHFIEALMTHLTVSNKYELKNMTSSHGKGCLKNCAFHHIEIYFEEKHGNVIPCWKLINVHQSEHLDTTEANRNY